jgi:glutamine cyclotransferase
MVEDLNELEYIHGEVYANVWETNRIARISPLTGRVLSWVDLSGTLPAGDVQDSNAVLNGIACDAKGDRLFVTGKLWPKPFEIKIVPRKEISSSNSPGNS